MGRKTNRRRMTRKKGGGCGCGGMEMLGFPKTGGFLGLFGGDEPVQSQGTTMPAQPMGMSAQPMGMSAQPTISNGSVMAPRRRPMKRQQPQSPGESFGTPMNTEQQQDVKGKKSRIVSEIRTLKSDVSRIKEQLSKMNTSFKVDNSPGLFGGYRPTKKNKKYLKMHKQGKSIGFTMRSSLKAKGLIPRANGTYKISNKYRG
jgi:hypothetical protein